MLPSIALPRRIQKNSFFLIYYFLTLKIKTCGDVGERERSCRMGKVEASLENVYYSVTTISHEHRSRRDAARLSPHDLQETLQPNW